MSARGNGRVSRRTARTPAGRSAEELRGGLTDRLIAQGSIRSAAVEAAFRAVPRHLFVPNVGIRAAYADDVVLMKRDATGEPISTVSQPSLVALMLEQAAVEPGHRVLEIGSGGYNAALLSELAGPSGAVTTIDIDDDVTTRARRALDRAGYERVQVVRTDGGFGWPGGAPYDRIVVTVTAGDIAPAWWEQLAPGGRIVVPLRLRGQTRSIAFDRTEDCLRSRSTVVCGFVSMQGVGAHHERVVPLVGDLVGLHLDEDQTVDVERLAGVLRESPVVEWSGIVVDREEPFSRLDLWLASVFAGYCVLVASRGAVRSGLVAPALQWGGSAIVRDGTIGYLTSRPGPSRELVELGARAHGPVADALVAELLDQLRAWDARHRHGRDPVFLVHPRETPADRLPDGPHFTTRNQRITLLWT